MFVILECVVRCWRDETGPRALCEPSVFAVLLQAEHMCVHISILVHEVGLIRDEID